MITPSIFRPAMFVAMAALVVLPGANERLQADLIARYDFDNEFEENGDELTSPNFVNADFTASNYNTRTSLYTLRNSAIDLPIQVGFIQASETPETFQTSTSDAYHVFEITVDNGIWDLTSMAYDYQIALGLNGQTYSSALFSDLDGFTTPIATFTFAPSSNGDTAVQTVTGDLTGNADFQGVAAGETIEFRIYFADNSTGVRAHRVGNLQVNASLSSIPEPTFALLGLALLAFAGTRRKRSQL